LDGSCLSVKNLYKILQVIIIYKDIKLFDIYKLQAWYVICLLIYYIVSFSAFNTQKNRINFKEEVMKKWLLATVLVIMCAFQANATEVNVWGEKYGLGTINTFYNSLAGHDSSIISGVLNSNDLSGVKLLWAVQPADAYTTAEIATMSQFLSTGGRIAFMGEHGSYAPDENARITSAIASLGGHITINTDMPDSGFHDATVGNGQILTHALTTGVNTYNYACFASLNLSGAAQALMVGTDHSQVMMAYENIGAGSIFLITDQNVWDNIGNTSYDNARMFENLLLGNTGAPPVNPVPEPSTLILLGAGLAGLGFARKRLGKK
jgi:hypothetical protein